jgi:predicted N-acetyltransferase YhbS
MINIREERVTDVAAREALLDAAYGDCRFTKASAPLREGRIAAKGLSLVAVERGQIVGTIRLWHVTAGPACPALLLGPLAVHPDYRNRGIGAALTNRALTRARLGGYRAVLLVGDAAYYNRFGFTAEQTPALWMPGRFERDRLLALELRPNALAGARGMIGATGEMQPKPDLMTLIAATRDTQHAGAQRAA